MHPSTDSARLEALVTAMTERLAHLTRTLGTWVQETPRDLQTIEEHVLRLVHELGASLMAGLATLRVPAEPPRTVPCPCGHAAAYQRHRPAQVTTLLGRLTVERPYYLCAACGQGQAPLDAELQVCAGSRSAGLDELLALLGATQDSFDEAASVLERLTLVQVSSNTVLAATEDLGAVLSAHQAEQAQAAAAGAPPPAPATPPARLYITMDGVQAHLHARGWSEVKVGSCYETCTRPDRKRPGQVNVHALRPSYVTTLAEAETFGWHLWQEAARRGVLEAGEVVVVGDGAHWIWNLAELHFPGATQILDWYHASQYVWEAATTVWGETGPKRAAWVKAQLDALWEGKVDDVLAELARRQAEGADVHEALSYYTTHRTRMDYPTYRARGLQVGSGTVESACKQLVSARLKQAGMIWTAAGAEGVATVRAWLKSGRWAEAMALRPVRRRGYQRQQPREGSVAGAGPADPPQLEPSASAPRPGRALTPEVLATLRAELDQERGPHPWRKAWSRRRQQEEADHVEQPAPPAVALAA